LAKTILLVEDDPDTRALLSSALKEAGYAVVEASDGRQGLGWARSVPVDLILLDIMLPVMSGYDALSALKANPVTAAIPVIAVSAKAMPPGHRRGLYARRQCLHHQAVSHRRGPAHHRRLRVDGTLSRAAIFSATPRSCCRRTNEFLEQAGNRVSAQLTLALELRDIFVLLALLNLLIRLNLLNLGSRIDSGLSSSRGCPFCVPAVPDAEPRERRGSGGRSSGGHTDIDAGTVLWRNG